ncbi:cysteine-rich receptor-like protein kinase 10 [Cryptomeria japonica]|uniref:cysteine-rich receptor-like protein kinase 10 n=1 Tax=Cryptomeria japonica TaxID=3369 RepID=UPI0027D9D184|nr:cysteine-rich receptor-like protein kinase 10 [Cryptomeria japonica]
MKIHVGLCLSYICSLLLLLGVLEVSCDLCCSQDGYSETSIVSGEFNVLNQNRTKELFNKILSNTLEECEGKSFYNFDSFSNASNAFPAFGSTGSSDIAKREVAAFLANAAFLTGEFCYINAIHSDLDYCDETYTTYPCTEGESYRGRGPIQLTWNFNYGAARDYFNLDLLDKPELVSTNSTISFQTALWFWMINSDCHTHIVSGEGFLETVKELGNSGGNCPEDIASRAKYYKTYCEQLGVDPGPNVECDTKSSSPIPSSGEGTRKPKKQMSKILGEIIGGAALISCLIFFLWSLHIRDQRRHTGNRGVEQIKPATVSFNYSYRVIEKATENFSAANKLGGGRFGEVYKGTLSDGEKIVVKKLLAAQSTRAMEEFDTEVENVCGFLHKNLVRLLGCCSEEHERYLIYEFMPNMSLDKHLFENNGKCLSWAERFEIITGIARGLTYLHEDSNAQIVHTDIKTSNILLDKNLQPKIANFGLANLFQKHESPLTGRDHGSMGYTAPEYAVHGQLTQKADVYSYGIVVLEIISGKKCNNTGYPAPMELLSQWAWSLYERNESISIADPRLQLGTLSPNEHSQILIAIHIALLCIQATSIQRPSMCNVLSMLSNDMEIVDVPTQPALLDFQNKLAASSSEPSPITSHSSITFPLFAR